MAAYYNEIDPHAAQWLRNLIAAGHIAPGDVDERSITEISADDLKGYTQCHFFAGIGIWSHALRRAGWSDDDAVWTGSCPCQPFSAAGKQKGFNDERHLWPVWFNLIRECRPAVVLGEQVASALQWVDLVSTDLERADYAFGASDLCAAGFDGAHIRQRLYFCAVDEGVGDSGAARLEGHAGHGDRIGKREEAPRSTSEGSCDRGLAVTDCGQFAGISDGEGRQSDRQAPGRIESDSEPAAGGELCGVEHAESLRWQGIGIRTAGWVQEDGIAQASNSGRYTSTPHLGRTPVDWLFCRDGKWRPVEPGTFPLADEAPARVGRLRAYGNGLDAETAAQFCASVMECMA